MPNPYDLMSMLFGQGQTNVQYPGPPQTMQNNSDAERQRLLDIMFNTQAAPVPEEKRNYMAEGLAVLGDAMARTWSPGGGGNALESIRAMRERRRQEAQQLEEAKAEQKRKRALIEYKGVEEKAAKFEAEKTASEERAARERAAAEGMAWDVGIVPLSGETPEQTKLRAYEKRKEVMAESQKQAERVKALEEDLDYTRKKHSLEMEQIQLANKRLSVQLDESGEKIDRRDKVQVSEMKQSLTNLIEGGLDEDNKPIPSLREQLDAGAEAIKAGAPATKVMTPDKVRRMVKQNIRINSELIDPRLMQAYIQYYNDVVEPVLQQFEDDQINNVTKELEAKGLAIPRKQKRTPESDVEKYAPTPPTPAHLRAFRPR